MATISITVPNAIVSRVQGAFASAYGYSATVPNPANPTGPAIPNPETIAQFVQRKIREYIQDMVRSQEAVTAAETARKAAITQANTDIVLT